MANTRNNIDRMIALMDAMFSDFESSMPNKPAPVVLSYGPVYRCQEKDIYAAVVLKLARVLSLVRAALLLCSRGYVQEQAIISRTIDETNEDILFLTHATTNGEITELHERYLEAFWEEEIDDSGEILKSAQKRPMIPRQKIHAYLARIEGPDLDPSTRQQVTRSISKTFSGFVHGAAPQIMDLYYGDPPKFHTHGMIGTYRHQEYIEDVWNYVYRSFLSFGFVAKALGAERHAEIFMKNLREIDAEAGVRD